jgi:hypothetical protein
MKTERLSIRVSKETKKIIQEKATIHKTTISNYLISIAKNKKIKIQSIADENALKLKVELTIIGKNLWTLIKYNKTLKLSEKIQLETIIQQLKNCSNSITNYYDRKNNNGN